MSNRQRKLRMEQMEARQMMAGDRSESGWEYVPSAAINLRRNRRTVGKDDRVKTVEPTFSGKTSPPQSAKIKSSRN